jgi:hypothetical protein
MSKKVGSEVFDFETTAYLAGGKAAVFFTDSKEMVGNTNTPTADLTPTNMKSTQIKFVKRGTTNKQPVEVMDKIYANSTLGANIQFNSMMAYGDGIMVVKKERDPVTKEIKIVEQLPSEQKEIFQFLDDNNYSYATQEWANDIICMYEAYCELIFPRDKSNKIVEINHVESVNSRISLANIETGAIEYHGYSTKWHEASQPDLKATPLLDRKNPLRDLKVRRGITLNMAGKTESPKDFSYIVQMMQPTPGRYYNGKPYWWAIFEAGWYDFACAIPKFKKALLQNQMSIKYHVTIHKDFWIKLFKSEGIPDTDLKARLARRKKFLKDMNDFLSGEENAGKSFVSEFDYDRIKGFETQDIIIKDIPGTLKGGEYLKDSEEVTNMICYAMGIHPSIIGASGNSGSINGTEARELFIIKQAMMKPIRDLLTLPLYIVKEINKWDPDVHFVVPNIMLTTVDNGTGAIKSVGNQKMP